MKAFQTLLLTSVQKLLSVPYLTIVALTFLTVPAAYGQQYISNTSSATASATVVNEMLGVEKMNNINFDNISVKSSSAVEFQKGSVKMNNSFIKVFGSDYEYSITIPTTEIVLQEAKTSKTMKIESFSIEYAAENSFDKAVFISANLSVHNKQAAGRYTSITPLTIIVNNN
jgi:hypothetical protein